MAASRAVLAAISHGKASVVRELDALFRRLNDEDVEMLKKAVHEEDTADAMLAWHRISGAGRIIVAIALAAACECVEAAARADNLQTLKASMPAFQCEVLRVNACLDSM